MNLAEFARLRNIKPNTARATAEAVLGAVPTEELTDEEISKLDNALVVSTADALPPEQRALAQATTEAIDPVNKRLIQHSIGAEALAANAEKYLRAHCKHLRDIKYAVDEANFHFIQACYDSTNEAFRITEAYTEQKADRYLEVVRKERGIIAQFGDALKEVFYPD